MTHLNSIGETSIAATAVAAPANMSTSKFFWIRAIVLGLLGVTLLWLVITRSLAAYLAEAAPEMALMLNANEPTALVRLADQKLMLIRHPPAIDFGAVFGEPKSKDGPRNRMGLFALLGLQLANDEARKAVSATKEADDAEQEAAAKQVGN